MKVSKDETIFQPVQIVLESKWELDVLSNALEFAYRASTNMSLGDKVLINDLRRNLNRIKYPKKAD